MLWNHNINSLKINYLINLLKNCNKSTVSFVSLSNIIIKNVWLCLCTYMCEFMYSYMWLCIFICYFIAWNGWTNLNKRNTMIRKHLKSSNTKKKPLNCVTGESNMAVFLFYEDGYNLHGKNSVSNKLSCILL